MAVCRRVPEVGSRSCRFLVADFIDVCLFCCCCSFRASSVDRRAHFDRLGLPVLGCRRKPRICHYNIKVDTGFSDTLPNGGGTCRARGFGRTVMSSKFGSGMLQEKLVFFSGHIVVVGQHQALVAMAKQGMSPVKISLKLLEAKRTLQCAANRTGSIAEESRGRARNTRQFDDHVWFRR